MHIMCISDPRSEVSGLISAKVQACSFASCRSAASNDYKEILCEKRKVASYIIPFACGILFSSHWDTKFG